MKQLIVFSVMLISLGCKEVSNTAPSSKRVNVDSLTSVFASGWNNKDSAAIMKTIGKDAIVMIDSIVYKGQSAIADKWISGGIKVINNITVSSIVNNGNDNIAYDGGTYTLNLAPPGGPKLKENGNYSFTWTKDASGEWKLSLIHIENVKTVADIQ